MPGSVVDKPGLDLLVPDVWEATPLYKIASCGISTAGHNCPSSILNKKPRRGCHTKGRGFLLPGGLCNVQTLDGCQSCISFPVSLALFTSPDGAAMTAAY